MEEELIEPQEAYLEVAAQVAVLNLLVAQMCAWFILETEDPKRTFIELEFAAKEHIRQSIIDVPNALKYLPQMLEAHSDSMNHLFESIRSRAGLEDEKPSNA